MLREPQNSCRNEARGIVCGKNRIARLMQQAKIRAKVHRRQKWNPYPHYQYPQGVDRLQRNFIADAPNRIWVSDITYIRTNEGWIYLTAILDLFSRRVVGYRLSDHMGQDIVINAFDDAVSLRQSENGLIFHSDRGMQYINDRFQDKLKNNNFLCSMSRKGNCFDNAVAESFFHTLKGELIRHERYQTKEQDKKEYIRVYF